MVARAQLLCFVVSLINLINDSCDKLCYFDI